jgi:hypothetical protein
LAEAEAEENALVVAVALEHFSIRPHIQFLKPGQ